MAVRAIPNFGGGPGGPATVTFPLLAPPGQMPQYGFTSGGGLRGTPSGGLALVAGGADALTLDAQGNVAVAQGFAVQGPTQLAGGLSTTTIAANSLTTTGAVSIGMGLGVAGNIQADGDLTAQKITARGDLGAASLSSTGPIAGATLSIAGKATLGSLEVKGTFAADAIESSGPFLFPTSTAAQPGVALADQPGTGVYGSPGTLGFALNGQNVGSFGGTTFTLALALAAQAGAFTTLQTSGPLAVGDALTVAGTAQLADIRGQSLALVAGATVGGDLQVQGTTRLANLAIDHISTDHDLTVGGNAAIQGGLTAQGPTQLAGGLVVQGATSLGAYSAGLATVQALRVPTADDAIPPVLQVPRPGGGADKYTAYLTGQGNFSISGALVVLGSSQLGGPVSLGAALSGTTASFTGGGTFGADLTTSGALAGALARLGGLAVQANAGPPEGQLPGGVGDVVIDSQSGQLYLKQSGAGTAMGWVRVTTAASSLSYPIQAPATTAAQGPSYSFASSSGDGVGSTGAGTLYLATGHVAALQFDASQNATFVGNVALQALQAAQANLTGTLQVGGATTLAGLSAGTTQLGALTAQNTQVADLLATGTAQVNGTTTFGTDVSVGGGLGVTGALQVGGAAASQVSLQAPLVLVGAQQVQSGTADPAASVTGNPGDLYTNRSAGTVWLKRTGTDAQGWVKLATSGDGLTFPLTAPDGQAAQPSYGFAGQIGHTVVGGKLAGISGGQVGYTLAGDLTFALAGALQVAGTTTLNANLTAQGATFAAAVQAAQLTVSGSTSLQGLTAGAASLGATNVASLNAQGAVQAAGALVGAQVQSGPSVWYAAAAAPGAGAGNPADLYSNSASGVANPLLVRVGTAWKAVAFVGDAAPTQFPLRGPADSAAAPNFAPSAASPGSGMYSAGANQLGFSTNGTSAATVDATQKWSFAGALTAPGGTFTQLQVNGPGTITGATTLGGTLQVQGAATLASSLTAASLAASGAITGASATISGALSAQSASTSGDVTVGGNLTVNGTTTYAGVQKTGALQLGDGTVTSPAVSFQAETGNGFYRPGNNQLAFVAAGAPTLTLAPNLATLPGALRVGATNAGLVSAGANQLALQTAGNTALSISAAGVSAFAFQAQHVGGTLTAPGVAVGAANTGLYTASNGTFGNSLAVALAGGPVANFTSGTVTGGSTVWRMGLGDPTSTTVQGGVIAGTVAPTGVVGATPAALYQYLGGGASQSLWVNESTTGAVAWAKVLTTSSPVAPTYPLQVPAGTAAAPQVASSSAAGSGFYFANGTFYAPAVAQSGVGVAWWQTFSLGGQPSYGMFYGPSGTSGGLITCAAAPNPNYAGSPAMLYQQPGAGPGNSLWVNESTSGASTSAWAKVLTSSSTIAPTFPLQATSLGSAAAPVFSCSVSGYTGTGLYFAPDAGSGNVPVLVQAANGQPIAFVEYGTANSIPIYSTFFGPPTVNASPYNGGVRSSAQQASGNIIAAPGQLAINNTGGAGTVLAVKESGVGNTTGWSFLYTQGSAQIAGQAGSTAAPYHSFSNSLSSGFSYQSSLGIVTSIAGTAVFNIGTTGAVFNTQWVGFPTGSASQPSICFNANQTSGFYTATAFSNPAIYATLAGSYWGGLVRYGNGTGTTGIGIDIGPTGNFANGGFIVSPNLPTNTATSSPGTLFISQQGSAWLKESGSQTQTGYAQLLTTSTQVPAGKLAYQAAAPTAIASVGQIYSLTSDGNLYYRNGAGTVFNISSPAFAPPASNTAPAATYTTTAADANRQFVNTSATQSAITLYTVPAGTDYSVTFMVGGTGGFSITAPSSQIIYVGATPTTASNISSATPGSTITLSNPAGAGTWFAVNLTGQWSVN